MLQTIITKDHFQMTFHATVAFVGESDRSDKIGIIHGDEVTLINAEGPFGNLTLIHHQTRKIFYISELRFKQNFSL